MNNFKNSWKFGSNALILNLINASKSINDHVAVLNHQQQYTSNITNHKIFYLIVIQLWNLTTSLQHAVKSNTHRF